MRVAHTKALMEAIVERSMEPTAREGLGSWAHQVVRTASVLEIAPHERPSQIEVLDAEVVARGVWRVTGGQSMDRPLGFTEEMANQLSRALSDLDADHLNPATASAIIQVGLFQRVRYRTV
jgi:hypothetical protein